MGDIQRALDSTISQLSDQNYDQKFTFYRFWFDLAQAHSEIPPDQAFDAIWGFRRTSAIQDGYGKLIHPTAPLALRFASDAESDRILAPHNIALRSRLCARFLREFLEGNVRNVRYGDSNSWEYGWELYYSDVNFVAHFVNLGYVEEAVIRDHILQSLISHQKLYHHQANGLIILFKLAGATFEKYAAPSVVDRCFELLEAHYNDRHSVHGLLVQEIIGLRSRGWEGLPPPPTLAIRKSKPEDQKDPAATPVVTSLGLPSGDPEPQIPRSQPPPLDPVTFSEVDTTPVTPATQSPSMSITSLSDFTVADTSDDESPIDPTTVTHHDTFYLEDGNVEVLCGNTLFRVHTSVLSFYSPVLRRMFAQTSLTMADSPNECPRILSSDTATDFTTLLKRVYLPEFPERNKMPDFVTFSSLLRITTKYELPTVRSQLLELVRDAYPETFEGLVPSKALGEKVFSGPTPHPNEVLNLFVQQKLTSALPMAYYIAARRGLRSLMNPRHPTRAQLSLETIQTAGEGLMALREMELKEIHRLITTPHRCLSQGCVSPKALGPGASDAERRVIDQIIGSSQSGTKILQVFSLDDICGGEPGGFCQSCEEWWESGHVEMRKKAWAALPSVFGLRA